MHLLSSFKNRSKNKVTTPGNFSAFGGRNGATVSMWDSEPGQRPGPQPANDSFNQPKKGGPAASSHPTRPSWDDNADSRGRKGKQKNAPSSNPGKGPESKESELVRGARMKVSKNVTVLGKDYGGASGRAPVNAETRGAAQQIIKQNKKGF